MKNLIGLLLMGTDAALANNVSDASMLGFSEEETGFVHALVGYSVQKAIGMNISEAIESPTLLDEFQKKFDVFKSLGVFIQYVQDHPERFPDEETRTRALILGSMDLNGIIKPGIQPNSEKDMMQTPAAIGFFRIAETFEF